jgi:hypothetical protein
MAKASVSTQKGVTRFSSSLRESIVCTVVLAAILIGCGGKSVSTLPGLPGTIVSDIKAGVRSFTHAGGSIGATRSGQRSIAAMFQATGTTASTLPESWQAGCTDLSQNFTNLRYALMTTEAGNPCGDPGNGVLTRDAPTATDVLNGPAINFDGTLAALVVTAEVNGSEIRCNNVTGTAAIHDGDHIQPWFDTQTGTVLLTSEHVVLAPTCTLPGIAAGAVGVHKVVIKFAKI